MLHSSVVLVFKEQERQMEIDLEDISSCSRKEKGH